MPVRLSRAATYVPAAFNSRRLSMLLRHLPLFVSVILVAALATVAVAPGLAGLAFTVMALGSVALPVFAWSTLEDERSPGR